MRAKRAGHRIKNNLIWWEKIKWLPGRKTLLGGKILAVSRKFRACFHLVLQFYRFSIKSEITCQCFEICAKVFVYFLCMNFLEKMSIGK